MSAHASHRCQSLAPLDLSCSSASACRWAWPLESHPNPAPDTSEDVSVPAPDPRRVRSPSVPSVEVSPSRGLRKAPCRMTVEIWPCNESWCQVVGHTSWHASRVARAYRASENRMLIGRYGASGQLRDGRMAEAPEHGCSKGAGRGRGRTRAFQSSPPRPKNSRSAGWDAWVAARHSNIRLP